MEIISVSKNNVDIDIWKVLDPNGDYVSKNVPYIINAKSIELIVKSIINIAKYVSKSDMICASSISSRRFVVVELVKKSKTQSKYEIMSEHVVLVKGTYLTTSTSNVFVKFDTVNIRVYNDGELENTISINSEDQLKPVYAYMISLLYLSMIDWKLHKELPAVIPLPRNAYIATESVLEILKGKKKIKNLPIFLSILANAGIWPYYSSDSIDEYVNKVTVSAESERLDKYKINNEIYKAQTLARLATDKFGHSINDLTAAQATTIGFIYEQNVNKKKCEHVSLYNSLIKFPSSKKWEELKKMSTPGSDVYGCTKCGVQFLCIHRVKVYEAIFENNIKVGSEAMDSILESFINAAGESSYNCYICGEEIKTRIDDRETIYLKGKYVRSAFVNDELSSRIWNFLNTLVAQLVFKSNTNTKLLVSNISGFLYDYVKSAEYATQSVDTPQADARNLHIKVYSYAAIVLFVSENPNVAHFNDVKPFDKPGDIGYVKNLFKFAHGEIVRTVTDVDSDLIKRMLISAYREISHYSVDIVVTKEDEIVDEFSNVSILYKYNKSIIAAYSKGKIDALSIIKSSNINVVDDIVVSDDISGAMYEMFKGYLEKTKNIRVKSKARERTFSGFTDLIEEINVDQSSHQYKLPSDWKLLYRIYDKDGNLHAFNKRSGNDLVCSICGDNANFIPDNPAKYSRAILEKITRKVDIASFYNMYTNKCPEGGIHSWVIGAPSCKKCSMTHQNALASDVEFYDKYRDKYVKDKKRIVNIEYSEELYEKKTIDIKVPDIDDLFHTLKNKVGGKINDFTNTIRGGNMAIAIISKCEQLNNKMAHSNPLLVNFASKYEGFSVDHSSILKKYSEIKQLSYTNILEKDALNKLYVAAILDFFIQISKEVSPVIVAFIELNVRFIELDRSLDEKIEFYAPKNEQTEETDILDSEDSMEAYLDVNPFDTSNIDMTEEELADNEKPGDD